MSGKLSDLTLEELWDLFPIILKDHSEKYKSWYVDQKLELENLLKSIGVARMSHIGSTAVPGLVSKPTVDILLEIFEDENIDHVETILCENGWIKMSEQKSPYLNYTFNKGYTPKGYAEKVFHLHVRHLGDWGELYFCEYLKEHSRVARDYGLLKEKLASEFPNNRDAYTDGKSEFVKLHTQQARLAFPNKYVFYKA